MTKRLNIQTVAEGVETKAHVEFLDSIGCDRLQGYYFSRPVTIEDFNEFAERKINFNSNHYSLIKNTSDFDFLKSKNSTPYLVFGKIPYGVCILSLKNKKLKLIYANDSYLKMTGCSANEDTETKEISYKIPDSKLSNTLKENCCLVAKDKNERTIILERNIRNRNKFISTKIYFLDSNSEESLIAVNTKDITEETEMQNQINSLNMEVSKSKSTIVDTLDSLPCGIIELQINGDSSEIIYHNDYSANILGYTNDEFASDIVKNPLLMVYDDDRTFAERLMEYYVQVQDYTTYELRLKKRDGSIIWVIGKMNLVNLNNKSYIQNTFIELTDKLADKHYTYTSEERVKSYYQYLHPLYENVPCAILHYTVEDEPIVIDFNDTYLETFTSYKTDAEKKEAYDKYIGNYMRSLIPGNIYDFDKRFIKYRKEHVSAVNEPICLNTDSGKVVHALLSCNIIDLPDGTKAYQDIYKLISTE